MLSAEQVQNAINELDSLYEDEDNAPKRWDYDYWTTVMDWEITYPITVDGVEYEVKLVEIGQEALDYEVYRAIIQIGNQFFRKNGWYSSHDGAYLDGSIDEVKKTKIVIEEWIEA